MAVERVYGNKREPVDVKVGELTTTSRAVNVKTKVVSKSEVKDIPMGRDGSPHRVCDALVGDETGCIYLTLWDDNIEKVSEGATLSLGNAYINLFKGNMRLNIGKYGSLNISEEALESEVNTENNLSNKFYEQERRPYRGGGRRDYGSRGRSSYRRRY